MTKAKQVLRDPTATLDELEFHVSFLPAGQTPHAPHKHPDEELIVIKEGTVEALVNGQTKKVGPGSVIFQAVEPDAHAPQRRRHARPCITCSGGTRRACSRPRRASRAASLRTRLR